MSSAAKDAAKKTRRDVYKAAGDAFEAGEPYASRELRRAAKVTRELAREAAEKAFEAGRPYPKDAKSKDRPSPLSSPPHRNLDKDDD